MTEKHPPGKQGRKKEDKENYEGKQRGTVGGVEAGCGKAGRGCPLRGEGQGEPGGDGGTFRLECLEYVGLFEVRSREVVEPSAFVAI